MSTADSLLLCMYTRSSGCGVPSVWVSDPEGGKGGGGGGVGLVRALPLLKVLMYI